MNAGMRRAFDRDIDALDGEAPNTVNHHPLQG
jgi:hypothetical protein